jgi:hypothetical protein
MSKSLSPEINLTIDKIKFIFCKLVQLFGNNFFFFFLNKG